MHSPADTSLLRQYLEAHSEEAFAELVRRHISLVYAAALRQVGGNQASAADVTQSVFTGLARNFEQRPLAEVGVRLGVGENAARMRVDRALDKLRTGLARRGITSTAAALPSLRRTGYLGRPDPSFAKPVLPPTAAPCPNRRRAQSSLPSV